MNLASTLLRTARRLPDHEAVIEPGRARHSYAQLADRAARLAGALAALGLAPGDRVALVMRNNASYVELLYACWWAGLAAVPVNAKLHPKELAYIFDDADVRVAFVTDEIDTTAIAAALSGDGCEFFDVEGPGYARLLRAEPRPLHPAAPTELAWLFYTSGTTGQPKGVMLTHRNLMAMSLNYLADVEHAAPGETLLHAAPMSHGSGLYILPNIAAGATQMVPASRGFDEAEIDELLVVRQGVKFFAAPTMVMRLAARLRGDARGLKTIVYGGGPMYVADCLRALEVFGLRLTQIYGQGESPMTITVLPPTEHQGADPARLARLGSVGRAQTGVEVAVLDGRDQPLPVGETGEVCVRGDTVMAGYLNRSEATVQTLANGWLHTGDLGRLDEAGYLTLVDRSKDLIISGGSNIYPREVEEALLRHAAVAEVAVIGVPDAEWGESVLAVVVPRPGRQLAADELDHFLLGELARFKRPRHYELVSDLPKNATGKVLKRELRERRRTD